ncbi:anthrax toxin receptor-like [Talpa occidentalis]|uniref:anthrax toxin receptor-like n=1 Tax=Talpa occidentalis TaxID=50954 RepID=UPI0023F95958|nr:anthrax toxin receptor-like [Talpa occidentalis]
MRSSCPWVLRIIFLLLLVLIPLLPSSGAYQHRAQSNLDEESTHHGHSQDTETRERLANHKKSCQSNLDLYLIVDKSGSVNNNWIFTYGFVEDFLKMFQNPKMRVSIITFSTLGHTVLKLTSNRKEIEDGLNKLRNTVPTGDTNMQEGFKAVNEQIANANSGVKKVHSMVISLTDGALSPEAFEATKNEAQRTRQLGGTVYAVGVNYYMKNQLLEIAASEDHVVGVDSGFYDLQNIVDSLADKSCIELTSVEPTNYCVGESSEALVFGRGFHNTKNKNEVLCRFQRSDTIYFDKRATQVEDTSIKCPGVKIEEAANDISVEVSLNNGASFISNGLKISSKDCGGHRNVHPVEYSDVADVVAVPMKRNIQFPEINPYQLAIVLAIILTPVMMWLLWRFFFRKNKEPVEPCTPNCPAVVVPCGGCEERNMNQLEKKMDNMCNFFQTCNQRPMMPCQPTGKW